jgi:hypothetical protein
MPNYLAIDGQMLMVAVKSGGRPTDDEMARLFERSGIKGDFRYQIRGYSSEEVLQVYRAGQKSSGLPDVQQEAMIQQGVMLMVASVMREKGLTGSLQIGRAAVSDAALSLYLFETNDLKRKVQHFPPPAAPKPRWKIWAKQPAAHLENAATTMDGYTLSCGPQVIAKYSVRNPSPNSGCAFEVIQQKDTGQPDIELSFVLSCPDCEKAYAFSNEFFRGGDGVREFHVNCPTCKSHRWVFRSISYFGEAWVLNICAHDKYLRAANVAVTGIQGRA